MSQLRPFTLRDQWTRYLLSGIALLFVLFFLLIPLVTIFHEALSEGWSSFWSALNDEDTGLSIGLTLLTALICIPLNLIFGIAAAWLIARFDFRGKSLLLTLIDLPFSISPVVVGLMYVLLLGSQSYLGQWFNQYDIQILFAIPSIVLVTTFVTFPFIARELIPLMQAQGSEEEHAAMVLGANTWQIFFKITLPNIKWGLLYGVILTNARAMGEFGAVSVVSGHIQGLTNTIPLQVEILYNDYNFIGAFAAAAILGGLAIATLLIKTLVEWQETRSLATPVPDIPNLDTPSALSEGSKS